MGDETVNWLLVDEEVLLASCDVHAHRASGPGGQRRNKVATAIRLVHRPTGVVAQGEDSRHQAQNKTAAVKRLRMNLACRFRQPVTLEPRELPDHVSQCLAGGRLTVGRKNRLFWPVAGFLLDVLAAHEGQLAAAAKWLGVSTANYSELLTSDKHLLTAANDLRKSHGHKPLR